MHGLITTKTEGAQQPDPGFEPYEITPTPNDVLQQHLLDAEYFRQEAARIQKKKAAAFIQACNNGVFLTAFGKGYADPRLHPELHN